MSDDAKVEHGIDEAFYASDGHQYRPFVRCLCGWGEHAYSWEDAGEALDAHLAEAITKGQP